MTVGVAHVGIGEDANGALTVDAARFDEYVLGLATIGAAVHAQRAADPARNGAQERQAGNTGFLSAARDLHVGQRGAGADTLPLLHRDVVETATEPDDHPGN